MIDRMQAMSMAGLFAVAAFAVFSVAQLDGRPGAQGAGDYRGAVVAEVHDAQGVVLLRGSFAPAEADDDGEVELRAALAPAAAGVTASGEAEIEYQKDQPHVQEVELNLTGLAAGTAVTLVIDGSRVTATTADGNGRVEIEIEVRGPEPATSATG